MAVSHISFQVFVYKTILVQEILSNSIVVIMRLQKNTVLASNGPIISPIRTRGIYIVGISHPQPKQPVTT